MSVHNIGTNSDKKPKQIYVMPKARNPRGARPYEDAQMYQTMYQAHYAPKMNHNKMIKTFYAAGETQRTVLAAQPFATIRQEQSMRAIADHTSDYTRQEARLGEKPTNVKADLLIARDFIDRHNSKHRNDLPEQRQFNLITTRGTAAKQGQKMAASPLKGALKTINVQKRSNSTMSNKY